MSTRQPGEGLALVEAPYRARVSRHSRAMEWAPVRPSRLDVNRQGHLRTGVIATAGTGAGAKPGNGTGSLALGVAMERRPKSLG